MGFYYGFVNWLIGLFRILWQMLQCMSAWMCVIVRIKSHMCSIRAHAWRSRRVAWDLSHACAESSAVTEPQKPVLLHLPLSLYFSITLAAPLSLLYSCLPSVLPSLVFHFSSQPCTFMTNCACLLLLSCCIPVIPSSQLCLSGMNLRWHWLNPLKCKESWEPAGPKQM